MVVAMAMPTVMAVAVIAAMVLGVAIVDAEEAPVMSIVGLGRQRQGQDRHQESGRNEYCFHRCLLPLRGGRQNRRPALNGR